VLKLLLHEDRNLNHVEGILMRPRANRDLPKSVRIKEVWDWLNMEVESPAIQQSTWEILPDTTTENALKLFIRDRIFIS
jgi:hypothetical protein